MIPATDSRGFEPTSRLLAALPESEFSSLEPHLKVVPLVRGSVLFDVHEPLTHLYFVQTGVTALLTTLKSRTTGMAVVGREGAVDLQSVLLGGDTALGQCRVLAPGTALAIQVSSLRSALHEMPTLRGICEAFSRALLVQILQAVPCNRLHTAEQRCARWLLMCADRTEDEIFEVAQESLAGMLGVPLSTVTAMASALHQAGLICYDRDAITVLDRRGLEAVACECYQILSGRYERMLVRAFE